MRPPFPDEITASNFLNHRSLLFLRPHSFFRLPLCRPLRRPLFSVYGVGLHTIGLGNSFSRLPLRLPLRRPLRRPLFSVYGVGLHTIGLGNSFGGGSLVQTIGSGG